MIQLIGRIKWAQGGLWAALIAAMIGSIQHVAWSFGTLSEGDTWSGLVQAAAVDIGLTALTLGIHRRKRENRSTTLIWVLMGLFGIVSLYANLLYGLAHQVELGLGFIETLRPFILSAVLPLMVISLSEVVSENVQHEHTETEKQKEKERQREQRRSRQSDTHNTRQSTPSKRLKSASSAHLLTLLTEQPGMNVTDMANQLGVVRGTVYNWLDELERNGKIVRSKEDGIKVMSNGHHQHA